VREAAERDREMQFTALLHHITEEQLAKNYRGLRRDAAPGVDDVTKAEYRQGLEGQLEDLHSRFHRGSYQPSISSGHALPKKTGRRDWRAERQPYYLINYSLGC